MEDTKTSVVKVTDASLKAKLGVLGLPPSFRIFIPDAQVFAHNLEELLNEKGAGSLREAFVTNGNMARNWKDIFSDYREEKEGAIHERSGTEFFMSSTLLITTRQNYVQSPVDDIESFLWVTLWVILKNNVEKATGEMESYVKDYERGNRVAALHEFRKPMYDEDALRNLIHEWATFSSNLSARYELTIKCFTRICEKNGWKSEAEEAQYWKAAWHGYALEGIFKSLHSIFNSLQDM